ncbi:subtilin biosynthesis protein spaC [Streptomyces oryzae]|uniref:Subtilin biosynthesis protein spaC n=1 Tax=Streptomyces oryzae TaxID=1434886 RepID=A0ABS3XCP0_9ACTN|nr:lanthionine synthetase LanC family protein [Streptomyces oryzae]MBO8193152.1 subtilin biosynthesis protein spaC [Streptomyces oryzae]
MTQHTLTDAGIRAVALRVAVTALDRWTDRAGRAAGQRPPDKPLGALPEAPPEHPGDPGIPVLARQVAAAGGPEAAAVAARACAVWARAAGGGPSHRGLYDGGLAGTLVGLRQSAVLHPALHPVADRLRDRLLDQRLGGQVPYGAVTFADYDLVLGPSGVLLALIADLGQARSTRERAGGGRGKPVTAVGDVPRAPQGFGKGLTGPRANGGGGRGGAGPAVSGPAGSGPADSGPAAYAEHLAALCDRPELPGLRAHYPGHPLLGWLHGRINTGMGHGVAGVTAALSAAVRWLGPRRELTAALAHTCRWLEAESFEDARDIRTWNGCGADGAPRLPGANARQAWCYGTPGVSWALWEAADVLADSAAAAWAAAAFTSLAEGFHEGYHLFGDHPGDRLGLCHGAAGVLAIADALHRHGQLPAATELRSRLLDHLAAHENELATLAEQRCGLLNGAGGALAAMLTATGGNRAWLPCLGLR